MQNKENLGHIIVLRANGVIEVVSACADVYEQAKELLGDVDIEVIRTMIPNLFMLVDEEGKRKKLLPNVMGTALHTNRLDFICGDIVLCDVRGGEFRALKDSGYVRKVLSFLGFREEIINE